VAREPSDHELVGAMLMVGVRGATRDDPVLRTDVEACRQAHVGGVILFDVDLPTMRGLMDAGAGQADARSRAVRNIVSPRQVRGLVGLLRELLGEGVLVGVDQEGGAVARLSPARGFTAHPSQQELGSMPAGDARARMDAMWAEIAACALDISFAPCVDVALNRENRVVVANGRCFSSDAAIVAERAGQSLEAAARAGVAACLKHFPGHGSSADDSHTGFVDITRTHDDVVELAPYRTLLGPGAPGTPMVMTGHLFDASVDRDHPASLSYEHTTRRLREGLGFDGVVVTDALDMGAVTGRYGLEEACVLAINAGADLLLDANNAPGSARECPATAMHGAVTRALVDGRIVGGRDRLRASWRRLAALRAGRRQVR